MYSFSLSNFATILECIALIGGILIVWFVYLALHPNMELRINAIQIPERSSVVAEFEIRNISKVRCIKRKVSVQFLHFESDNEHYSEWVPFIENKIKPEERPTTWSAPIDILETTKFWYPGDVTRVERSFNCPAPGLYKIGLQAEVQIPWLARAVNIFQRPWLKRERWTTTKIIWVA